MELDQLQLEHLTGYLWIFDSKRIEASQRIIILVECLMTRSVENLNGKALLLVVPMPNANDEVADRVNILRHGEPSHPQSLKKPRRTINLVVIQEFIHDRFLLSTVITPKPIPQLI